MFTYSNKAFTLIELLVVIAIIGLLSSVVLASLSGARKSARDARRQQDLNQLRTALTMFYNENGDMPDNYEPGSGACSDGSSGGHADAYEQSMQELVDGGYLPTIPDTSGDLGYCYYDYGSDSDAGALIVTRLETIQSTTTPPLNSCRPFNDNWCSHTRADKDFCICVPY